MIIAGFIMVLVAILAKLVPSFLLTILGMVLIIVGIFQKLPSLLSSN